MILAPDCFEKFSEIGKDYWNYKCWCMKIWSKTKYLCENPPETWKLLIISVQRLSITHFHTSILFLYPLKTWKSHDYISRGYRNKTLAWNRLRSDILTATDTTVEITKTHSHQHNTQSNIKRFIYSGRKYYFFTIKRQQNLALQNW